MLPKELLYWLFCEAIPGRPSTGQAPAPRHRRDIRDQALKKTKRKSKGGAVDAPEVIDIRHIDQPMFRWEHSTSS